MEHNFHDEENNVQNIACKDVIDKLKKLAESARICMFTTFTTTRPMPSRPMALQSVDDDGTLYFFSATTSDKNAELAADSDVQLFFEKNGRSEYLSVYGKATTS